MNAASPILRLTRAGETAWGPLPGYDWTIFQANHSTYEPLAWAHRDSLDYATNRSPLATVMQVGIIFCRSGTGFIIVIEQEIDLRNSLLSINLPYIKT